MNAQELEKARKVFEEAGIQFVREVEPGSGPRFGTLLTSAKDQKGDVWVAIGPGSIDPDVRASLREVLQWVANREN